MFKCLYPALCVHVKLSYLLAVEQDGDYKGLVEPILVGEADGTACLQLAQSGNRYGRHGNSYSDLSSTGTILGHGCAQVLDSGNFFQLLAVHGGVCTGVGRSVNHDIELLRQLMS